MVTYADLSLGVADASILAAGRLEITQIATWDRRDVSVVRPRHVAAFELLPWCLARRRTTSCANMWHEPLGATMPLSPEERHAFALIGKLKAQPYGRPHGGLFGSGTGLEDAQSIVLQHFSHDFNRIRQFGVGATNLIDRFEDMGRITLDDVADMMGAGQWPMVPPGGDYPPGTTQQQRDAAGLGANCMMLLNRTGLGEPGGLLENWFRDRDDIALEITTWLSVALARLEAAGRTAPAPSPSRTASGGARSAPSRPSASAAAGSKSSGCGSVVALGLLGSAALIRLASR